jgi:acetamidase/formamidase
MQHCWLTLAAFSLAAGTAAGETHKFEPKTYWNSFFAGHAPVLRIKPGDRVETRTVDARGFDAANRKVAERPNPQTGPFYVEGAEPGDMLVVRIEKIEPNRPTAWCSHYIAAHIVDTPNARDPKGREQPATWTLDLRKRVARIDIPASRSKRLELPLKPMLGCVGTAPADGKEVPTSTPERFGGNMDYNGVVAGTSVMLPVSEPGALLFVGDGHATQSDGEILGNGTEVSMDVVFSVDLVKGKKIGWPRLESADYIAALGSARPLFDALKHATAELEKWLMEDYGFDEHGASLLIGQAGEYDVANVVDPNYTVAAKIRKSLLPGR